MYDDLIDGQQRSVDLSELSTLAPVLGAKRDGSATVDTSRGLLMTILGELVLPNGGSAWTQTLVELMELLGVRDKAARQSIARIHERGWLERSKVGRQTRWTLTGSARGLLEAGAERIYGFGRDARHWDGSWLVLLASVPERNRNARYRLSTGLSWAGFGSIGQGIWLTPWPSQEPVAVELCCELGVNATSFRAELGSLGSGPALVAEAWDLPGLRIHYDEFLADTDALIAAPPQGEVAAAELTALVHRWRRFPFLDPDLPSVLLPSDWPGPFAARRFGDLRAALVPPATEWWVSTEAHYTP